MHDSDCRRRCQDDWSSAMAVISLSQSCTLPTQKGLAQEYIRGKRFRKGPPLSAISRSYTSTISAQSSNSDHLPRTLHSSRLIQGQCDSSLRQLRVLHQLGAWKSRLQLPGSMLKVREELQGAYCLPVSIH